MRLQFRMITLIISGLILYAPVSGAEVSDLKIIGQLVRVDDSSGIIYVMHDSRIVKFRASKDICRKYRNSLKSYVEIVYSRCSEKGFCVISMDIVPEEGRDAESSELKSFKQFKMRCSF